MFDIFFDYNLLDVFSCLAIFVIIFDVRMHFTSKTNGFFNYLPESFIFNFTYDLICFAVEFALVVYG